MRVNKRGLLLLILIVVIILSSNSVFAASWHNYETCNPSDKSQIYAFKNVIEGSKTLFSNSNDNSLFSFAYTGDGDSYVLKDYLNPNSPTFSVNKCFPGKENYFSTAHKDVLTCGDQAVAWAYSFIFVKERVNLTVDFKYDDGGFIHFLWYDRLHDDFDVISNNVYQTVNTAGEIDDISVNLTKAGWYLVYIGFGDDHHCYGSGKGTESNANNVRDQWGNGVSFADVGIIPDNSFDIENATYDADNFEQYCDSTYGEGVRKNFATNDAGETFCCGDDPEDNLKYFGDKVCINRNYGISDDFVTPLWELIDVLDTDQDGMNSYCSDMGGDSLLFVEDPTKSYVYDAKNGADGCCGDDIRSQLYGKCVPDPNSCKDQTNAHDCSAVECEPILDLSYTYGTALKYDESGEYSGYYILISNAPSCDVGLTEVDKETEPVTLYDQVTGQLRSKTYVSRRTCSNYTGCIVPELEKCENALSNETCVDTHCDWIPTIDDTFQVYDVGYIFDGKYMCEDINPSQTAESYNWTNVEQNNVPYTIKSVENTHFISNSENWFYCNATGNEYGSSAMKEGNSFKNVFPNGERSCSATIAALAALTTEESKVKAIDCEDYKDVADPFRECQTQAEDDASSYDVYVVCKREDGKPASYNASAIFTDSGGFDTVCLDDDVCAQYDSVEGWNSFEYNKVKEDGSSITTFSDLCEAITNDLYGCASPSTLAQAGVRSIDQDYFNSPYASEQMRQSYNAQDTCYNIVHAINPNQWNNNRVCDVESVDTKTDPLQVCVDGVMVYSKEIGQDAPSRQCCVGVNAYCEDYSMDICLDQGYDFVNNSEGLYCAGQKIDETCCTGTWIEKPELFFSSQAQNDSFICYQRNNYSFIQECCDVNSTCYNKANPINSQNIIPDKVYSYAGVPLHTIDSFDQSDGQETRILTGKADNEVTLEHFGLEDWTGFDRLNFDFVLNSENVDQIILIDNKGTEWSQNFKDNVIINKSLRKPNRISVPLPGVGSDFNLSNVKKMKINFSEIYNVEVWLDNIYLEDTTGTHATETYYCSGPFKSWVKNLDGPGDDKGFYEDPDNKNKNLSIAKYGEYKYACDAQAPFAWTGSVCCGDDSRDGYGEYWVDANGICWGGTYVLNDQSLGYNIGYDLAEPIENSVLFYDNTASLCDVDSVGNALESKFLSFNSSEEGSRLSAATNQESVAPFTVRGNWICEEGGKWTRLSEFNRLRVLLSVFLGSMDGKTDYTIFCGDSKDVRNSFAILDNLHVEQWEALTDNACILTQTSTDPNVFQKMYFGGELNSSISVNEYSEGLLKQFNPFVNYTVDCGNVGSNPAPEDFFTACDVTNDDGGQSEFVVYYNDPFKLIIIGSEPIISGNVNNNLGFFPNLWNKIVSFFKGLFVPDNNEFDLTLDLVQQSGITEYYATMRGLGDNTKLIRGIRDESYAGEQKLRVDYEKLANDKGVKFLADAFKQKYPDANVRYIAENESQSIIVTAKDSSDLDWKTLTSIIRLNNKGNARNFGENECGDGVLGYNEDCDGDNLGGYVDCVDYNASLYMDGKLGCYPNGAENECEFDTSLCKLRPVDPTCNDGEMNQNETAVDCGGECDGCPIGKECKDTSDCANGLECSGNTVKTCQRPIVPLCENGVQDSGEDGVDCGGHCPNACNTIPCENPCIAGAICKNGVSCIDGCCAD